MAECNVQFPGPVSRKTMAYLVIDYMKYVLYYRGQIPSPLDQLLKQLETEEDELSSHSSFPTVDGHMIYCDDSDLNTHSSTISSSVTTSRAKQKFNETVSKFDEFFSELAKILETRDVKEIVLNLGPNLMNPKECYHISIPKTCSKEGCTADYASLQNCKLILFQNIITSDIWAGVQGDSLLPISVLLLLEKGVPLEDHMELKRFYALPKKCKQRTLRFVDRCCHIDDSSMELGSLLVANNSTASINMRTSGLWVKLKPDLKGFVRPKE